MNFVYLDTITLLRSAVTGRKLPLSQEFDFDAVFACLKTSGLLNAGYIGACNCGISKELPQMKELFAAYCRSVIYSQQQLQQAQKLYSAFEANGVDYMPVKGLVLKGLYPNHELRPMGDGDILIRLEQYPVICQIMKSLGYQQGKETGHELPWYKKELKVELHKRLIPSGNGELSRYYDNAWVFARETRAHCYCMKPEDHFVYLFAHFVKHYCSGGIGLRHILDLWLFLETNRDMNIEYILEQLRKLKLDEFYSHIYKLIRVWFYDESWNERTRFLTGRLFSAGVWGSLKQHDISCNAKFAEGYDSLNTAKNEYFWFRVFPPYKEMCFRYPVLNRAGFLLPVCWIVRMISILIHKPKTLNRRLRMLDKSMNQDILAWKQELEYVGLGFWQDLSEDL